MNKPKIFNKTKKFSHSENRMRNEGNVIEARYNFYKKGSPNLKLLIENRYKWMNKYILPSDVGIEVGAGAGFSKDFIKSMNFKITDKANYEWLDIKNIDALNMPFENNSLDFILCSNMIHHLAIPSVFFKEVSRVLKNGGKLIIQEINASLLMRLLLSLMKHEGYSYDVDPFDDNCICTDKDNLWSANCAIPNLLFDNPIIFEKKIPVFKFKHSSFDECIAFINSGGVISKTFFLPLPKYFVKIIQKLDKLLCCFPSLFALQRQVVLEKRLK